MTSISSLYTKYNLPQTKTEEKKSSQTTNQTASGSTANSTSKPGQVDADKTASLIQKGYDQVMGKINKDFKDKGSGTYKLALKSVQKELKSMTPEAFGESVMNQIKQNRQQKGKTGALSEAEINVAVATVSKNVRHNFEQKMVTTMKSSMSTSSKYGGSGRGSLMDFMA